MDGPIEVNKDAMGAGMAPDSAPYSPTVGFLDGIQTSFRQTTEVTNQLAQETALRDREQSQIKRIREAGGAAPPSLNDVEDDGGGELPYATTMNGDLYRRTGRLYGGTDDGSQDSDVAEALGRRNAKLTELQKQYPQLGIQTYDQMFSDTQAKAKELTDTLDKSPTSLGGKVGEFVGGMVGSMSPRTAPVTFGTLGVPIAEGASLATRAVTQGAAAGGGDVISQVTGGDEGRGLLLGDDGGYRFGQTAEAVAGGAGGELAIAGAAKAFGFGFRAAKNKLFPDADIAAPERIEPMMDKPGTPPDPGVTFQPPEVYGPAEPMDPRGFRYPSGTKFDKAGDPIYPDGISFFRDPANMRPPDDLPRVSPLDSYEIFRSSLDDYTQQAYGSSRLSAALAQIENANVTYQLGAWDGPAPWEIAPRTAATPVPDVTHVNFGKPLTKLLAGEGPEAIARRIDPDVFAQVDRYSREMEAGRQRLESLRVDRDRPGAEKIADLQRQVDAAQERVDNSTGKRQRPAQENLQTLTEQRDAAISEMRSVPDNEAMAKERAALMKLDEGQRDMAPLVSRAFHAANSEWSAGRYDPDTIRFFKDLEAHPRMRWKDDATVQPSVVDPAWLRAREGVPRPPERPSIAEQVPELRNASQETSQGDKPAVDTVQKILDENRKAQEPEVERFQQHVAELLRDDVIRKTPEDGVDPNVIRINNVDVHLDKDKMFIPTEDGDGMKEVSVRTFLKELQQDTDAYKAIGTCSRS